MEPLGAVIAAVFLNAFPALGRARFETVTNANHNTRLECAFVDFEESNGPWHVGRIINEALLCKLIEHVKEGATQVYQCGLTTATLL
jgi:hypothetical protein